MTRTADIEARTKRLGEIVSVFARYGLAEPLREHAPEAVRRHLVDPDGSVAARPAPERLRLALQELGPTFVKLGQMLSLTLGALPAGYAEELAKLQERVEPEPTAVARATIQLELGKTVDELYASFGDEPLAAASMAQVYRAGLADGSALAVKVQRDGIQQQVLTDLELISYLAGVLEDHSAELRLYRPREFAARFRSRMLEELDFGREASNAERFAENFSGEPDVVFPRIYPELSTSRVLTMSLIEGTTFASMTPEELSSIDGKALGERGAEVWLEMVFRDGFVHADPHPGNLVVLPGSRLGIIDEGMVVRIDDRTQEQFEELYDALVGGSGADFTDALLATCKHPPDVDRDALTDDVVALMDKYGEGLFGKMRADDAIHDLAAVVHKHQLSFPAKIEMLLQVVAELEGTSRLLDADFRLMPLLEANRPKLLQERFTPAAIERRLGSFARGWRRRGHELLDTIDVVGERLRSGNLELRVTHTALDPVANRLVQGLISAALLVASAILWQARAVPVVRGVPILAAAGLAVSVLIAGRLLYRIHRSGEG